MRRGVLLCLLLALVGSYYALDLGQWLNLASLQRHQAQWQAWVDGHFLLAALGFFFLYVLSTGLSLPGATLLTLGGSALLGIGWGLLLVSLASTLGASLAFLSARYLLRGVVSRRFGPQLERINGGLERDGIYYLMTLRLVPLFPFFMVNLLMGLTRMPLTTYAWVSQLGMLPATCIYVLAGSELATLASTGEVLSPALITTLCLLGLLPWLGKFIAARLAERRRRQRWPKPKHFDYNLLVVGAGAGGLVTSYIAAVTGARVGLIEARAMGGDCLNHGCVPSKALLRSARFAAEQRRAGELGFSPGQSRPDFAAVMERVARVITEVAPHDSIERYQGLGVECIEGRAHLRSPWSVEVNGAVLTARHLVIATGARPRVPPIPGLEGVNYLTSDTLWDLRRPPRHLMILGGGPIGCELAQAFALLGVPVTLIEQAERLLPREEPDAARVIEKTLCSCGVDVKLACQTLAVAQDGEAITLHLLKEQDEHRITGDTLLLALGRQANVTGFGLEALGVELTDQGTIRVDDTLATTHPSILAVGDVAGPYQLTHVAAHQGWYAAINALFGSLRRFRVDYRAIPQVVYTEPQLARVGLTTAEASERTIGFERTRFELAELDRAICDAEREGFVEVLTAPGSDRLLGVTLVGPEAGERIAEFTLAMQHGLGLGKILATVHPYPTRSEGNKYVAGLWRQARKPGLLLTLAGRWHAWRRGPLPPHSES